MIYSVVKVALRVIWKSKRFSFIAISGLVAGMAGFAMIMQYVFFETSFDKFQSESENIYRVAFTVKGNDKEPVGYATTFLPVAPAMKDEFHEVVDYNRILYLDRHAVVTYDEKSFQQEGVIYSDPSFFAFFDYPLIKGDAKTALREANTVVISESMAEKYFGDKNPVGQFMKLSEEFNELSLLVTGVHEEIPSNTHLKPKMVVSLKSIETLPVTMSNLWTWPIYLNYIRLQQGANPASLESKFTKFKSKHIQHNKDKTEYSFFLQPLPSIHLHSHLEYEIEENGSTTMVYLLLFSAILILIIAYVNYINLATAWSISRAKEIGVRKALGSLNSQMVGQFVLEAALLNLMAVILAGGVVLTGQRYFLEFTGIEFDFSLTNVPWFWFILACSLVVGTLLSSFYPSWIITSVSSITALKGQHKSSGGSFAREVLVILQFTATIVLMINAYAVYMQVKFMRTESPGIDINPILIVNSSRVTETLPMTDRIEQNEDPFKTAALKISGIQDACVSASIPGVWISKARGIYRIGHEQEKDMTYHTLGIDYDFLETYSMRLLAGRNFSQQSQADNDAIVLTQKAAKQLGFSNPQQAVGDRVMMLEKVREVIGVVQDYHHLSLREDFQAIVFYPEWEHKEFYSLKLEEGSTQKVADVVKQLEEEWKAVYPSSPFEFSFLNSSFQSQYDADIKFGQVFNLFTVLGILLACLGLFGLVSFMALKRTKEIGIRRVLGSSSVEIARLMFMDVGKLLLLAGFMSVPIAYLTLNNWLSQFAFRIDLSGWIFVIPLLFVAVIGLASVSYQILRSATTNPVTALKYE